MEYLESVDDTIIERICAKIIKSGNINDLRSFMLTKQRYYRICMKQLYKGNLFAMLDDETIKMIIKEMINDLDFYGLIRLEKTDKRCRRLTRAVIHQLKNYLQKYVNQCIKNINFIQSAQIIDVYYEPSDDTEPLFIINVNTNIDTNWYLEGYLDDADGDRKKHIIDEKFTQFEQCLSIIAHEDGRPNDEGSEDHLIRSYGFTIVENLFKRFEG